MTNRLIFLRHGQYDRGDKRPGGGDLTPIGIQQSHLSAKTLADEEIGLLLTSTLNRAVTTSEICLEHLSVGSHSSLQALCEVTLSSLLEEPGLIGQKLADEAYRLLFQQHTSIGSTLVIGHGNMIRYFVCRVLALDPQCILELQTNNCGISVFDRSQSGNWCLARYNDTSHLPRNLTTED